MSNGTNGNVVRQFEEAFAQYVGAKYAIACCNGTATLHTALVALGVKPGDRVAVPPLTMASTTLAVLHAGAVPKFVDVDSRSWVMKVCGERWSMPVGLYGYDPFRAAEVQCVIDAAQCLQKLVPNDTCMGFRSYSFQASKLLSAGEGGMLVTDDLELAARARQFSRLGYEDKERMIPDLKHPAAIRHISMGYNYRMADCQAALLLPQLERADEILAARRYSAQCYREAISGCDWLTPQYVPEGWPHSYWTYAVALKDAAQWEPFAQAIVQAGGERPYAAWLPTYLEPAFKHLGYAGLCPIAEDLQPRLVQLQTNHDKGGSERAAECLRKAIREVGW